ncbi:MAG: hypothetical protein M3512_10130 [Bacteroidota bacterium]|nr:hypothetical protein [Bacteroidota bacterium]
MNRIILVGDLVLRYVLGLIMIAYGLIKILEIQFVLPQSVYDIPLKDLDGVTLVWAFLGFSSWFTVLLGIMEFIPATLVLFRRTKLIGTLLLLPSTFSIFLINNAYEFLPHMRFFTGILLIINLILIALHYKLFIRVLKELIFYNNKGKKIEVTVNILLIFLIVLYIILYLK